MASVARNVLLPKSTKYENEKQLLDQFCYCSPLFVEEYENLEAKALGLQKALDQSSNSGNTACGLLTGSVEARSPRRLQKH